MVAPNWRGLTPTELLDAFVVLTLTQTAYALNLVHYRGAKKGEPDYRAVVALIEAGRLDPVDPTQPPYRLTVSSAEVRRYLAGEPKRRRPLRAADAAV